MRSIDALRRHLHAFEAEAARRSASPPLHPNAQGSWLHAQLDDVIALFAAQNACRALIAHLERSDKGLGPETAERLLAAATGLARDEQGYSALTSRYATAYRDVYRVLVLTCQVEGDDQAASPAPPAPAAPPAFEGFDGAEAFWATATAPEPRATPDPEETAEGGGELETAVDVLRRVYVTSGPIESHEIEQALAAVLRTSITSISLDRDVGILPRPQRLEIRVRWDATGQIVVTLYSTKKAVLGGRGLPSERATMARILTAAGYQVRP